MLSIFPIHFLSLFAYFILRVVIGIILLYLGLRHLSYFSELRHVLKLTWWPFGALSTLIFITAELTLGIFIIIGAYTQLATLIVALMSLKLFFLRPWFDHHTLPPRLFYLLLLAASLALTITGAGVLAVDLPL